MLDFQIGERVRWQVGKIKATGCFLEHLDNDMCAIIVHTVNGQSAPREIQVDKSILELDI